MYLTADIEEYYVKYLEVVIPMILASSKYTSQKYFYLTDVSDIDIGLDIKCNPHTIFEVDVNNNLTEESEKKAAMLFMLRFVKESKFTRLFWLTSEISRICSSGSVFEKAMLLCFCKKIKDNNYLDYSKEKISDAEIYLDNASLIVELKNELDYIDGVVNNVYLSARLINTITYANREQILPIIGNLDAELALILFGTDSLT